MKAPVDEPSKHLSEHLKGLKSSGKLLASKEYESCTFKDCDFSEVKFANCRFIDCTFTACNLSLVDVAGSSFRDVAFHECKAIGINWTKASWPKLMLSSPLKFHKCIINDSSFFGLNLEEIVMEECKAHDVDLREGNFSRANFSFTDFTNSLFGKTNLSGADMTEASNYNIDLHENNIRGARFSRHEAIRLLDCLEIELVD
jgi:fluoroquinolone resistance protein